MAFFLSCPGRRRCYDLNMGLVVCTKATCRLLLGLLRFSNQRHSLSHASYVHSNTNLSPGSRLQCISGLCVATRPILQWGSSAQ